jgi:hypothetical protein
MPSKRANKTQKPSPVFNEIDSYLIHNGIKTSHVLPSKEKVSVKLETGKEFWVREAWQMYPEDVTDYFNYRHQNNIPVSRKPQGYRIIYKADIHDEITRKLLRWRSPLVMPKWAARSSITITSSYRTSLDEVPLHIIKQTGIQYYPDYQYELEDPDKISEENYIINFFKEKIFAMYNRLSEIIVVEFSVNQINGA